MTQINPEADFRVTLDGQDLSERFRPRLLSLNLTESRSEEADQIDITVHDHDGRMALPKKGAVLDVALGWKDGKAPPGQSAGLVDKGKFKVDEVEWSGSPDVIVIRARSADFTASFRERRQKSWKNTTLGAVLREIAGRHKLQAQIDAGLASKPIAVLEQSRESDSALLRRLGRQYDAVATVKAGKLLFSPAGQATTASGQALADLTVTRRTGDRYRYRSADRDGYSGVKASWHDVRAARRQTVLVGGDGAKVKSLRRVYGSEAQARRAAEAEFKRVGRAGGEFSITPAWGLPSAFPARPVTASGFKPEIDAARWIVKQVTHTLSESGGLTSTLDMEIRA